MLKPGAPLWISSLIFFGAVSASSAAQTGAASRPSGESAGVSAEQAAFYRKAFPQAAHFRIRRVPGEMLPAEDRGNETYVEARNAQNELLGYLRDFLGPISTSPVCPCSPLALTLVFGPDLSFRTLITEAPLEKYGHQPMTPAETERLIRIVKSPAPALMRAGRVEDLLDAVTGATRTEYRDFVVSEAALTTKRVAALVRDTAQMIRGAPLARDRMTYQRIVGAETDEAALARKLADFLPQAESPEAIAQTYEAMVIYYARALKQGRAREPKVEGLIVAPYETRPADVVRGCQYLAAERVALAFVRDCVGKLETRAASLHPAEWALLRGTEAFESGRVAEAIEPLRVAATSFDHNQDPALHMRLVKALQAQGQVAEACRRLKPLFRDQPRYPGAEALLGICGEPVEELAMRLRDERRRAVLATRRAGSAPTPALAVAEEGGRPNPIDLSRAGKVTVLIFFAAWCPHCRESFPEFKEFGSFLQREPALRDRVQLVGVRTFAERDQEPYAAFAERFQPNFPVWHDGPQGKNFREWASLYGFPSSIPRILVVDRRGVLRFVVDSAGYRDFMQELRWATEAVVAEP